MTYKQIEASREIRLWIGQVIVPALAFSMAFPEARQAAARKAKDIKDKLTSELDNMRVSHMFSHFSQKIVKLPKKRGSIFRFKRLF